MMNYKINPEEAECMALTDYLEILKQREEVLVFSHTAQETYTKSWRQKHRNKAVGVRPGVPDYIIVTPKEVLFIEMKRPKGGRVSDEQLRWLVALEGKPVVTQVCHGFDQAKEFLNKHIGKE